MVRLWSCWWLCLQIASVERWFTRWTVNMFASMRKCKCVLLQRNLEVVLWGHRVYPQSMFARCCSATPKWSTRRPCTRWRYARTTGAWAFRRAAPTIAPHWRRWRAFRYTLCNVLSACVQMCFVRVHYEGMPACVIYVYVVIVGPDWPNISGLSHHVRVEIDNNSSGMLRALSMRVWMLRLQSFTVEDN